MNILALEFSSPRRSVAVFNGTVVTGRASEEGTRETHAFSLIDQALAESALTRQSIECIAVGVGPGSYAGIRIAIAIAQGWSLARGVKLVPVSSADAVAAQAYEQAWRGILHTIIDAQRKEFFGATYAIEEIGWRHVEPFRLLTVKPEGRCVRFDLLAALDDECMVADAAMIAQLAARSNNFVDAPGLSPIYLRKAEFVKAPPSRFAEGA